MKKNRLLFTGLMAVWLVLVLTSCGAKGGTITLVNETTYELHDAYISLGESQVEVLKPGEWMKASVDKNVAIANVKFTFKDYSYGLGERPRDFVEVLRYGGTWIALSGRLTSGGISVQNGDNVFVYVRNVIKTQP